MRVEDDTLVDIVGFKNSGIEDPDWKTKAKWEDSCLVVTNKWANLPEDMRKDYYISVSYEGRMLYSFLCFNVFVPRKYKGIIRFSDTFNVQYTD